MAIDYRPFVFYGGNCRDAFTRYQVILGGELALLRLADAPSAEPVPPEQADLIVHAALTTDGAYVMGSDDPTGEFTGIQGMSVSVSVDDADEAPRVRRAGRRRTGHPPLTETFFSPAFGMCVDRFGVPWMIVAASPDTRRPTALRSRVASGLGQSSQDQREPSLPRYATRQLGCSVLVTSVAGCHPGHELGTILHPELPQDVRDMSLDRLPRQEQRARDVRVAGATRDGFAISRSRSLSTERSPLARVRGPRRHVRMPSWRRSWSTWARSVAAPASSAIAEASHRIASAPAVSPWAAFARARLVHAQIDSMRIPRCVRPVDGFSNRGTVPAPRCGEGRSARRWSHAWRSPHGGACSASSNQRSASTTSPMRASDSVAALMKSRPHRVRARPSCPSGQRRSTRVPRRRSRFRRAASAARDGLMELNAMMRIPFVLAQGLKAGECGAVVAGGDRGDEPPHPREHRGPRRLAHAFHERLTFLGHLLSLDQAAAQVPRLGEPRPDVEGDPRKDARRASNQAAVSCSSASARRPRCARAEPRRRLACSDASMPAPAATRVNSSTSGNMSSGSFACIAPTQARTRVRWYALWKRGSSVSVGPVEAARRARRRARRS